ncbi:MAG: cell division protein FtsQ/DivIB [Thermoleophilaceae bacterium]
MSPSPRTPPARAKAAPSAGSLRRAAVIAGTVLLGFLALYGLWLRDSSLVRVERVEVTGLTGRDAPRMRSRLVSAAREMTTLNVRIQDLEEALAAHPALRRVEANARLPHTLEVHVVEHRPVALLRSGRRDGPAVAGDGTLLRGLQPTHPLAVVQVGRLPSGEGRRLRDRRARRLVRALAAAPHPLTPRLSGAAEEPGRGVVLRMRHGPAVVLGDLGDLKVKWAATARVLADPASRGAAYVDVRMPERPVAGGLVEPAAEAGADAQPAGSVAGSPPAAVPAAGAGATATSTPTGTPSAGGSGSASTAPDASDVSDPGNP